MDEASGRVLAEGSEDAIAGLYAAGRTAVGIASNHYVSGLSLADCIWSGRNAGRAIAAGLRGAERDSAVPDAGSSPKGR
ncbi:hypothetical protein ACU4HD_41780 [Cupriavidus basilensis]